MPLHLLQKVNNWLLVDNRLKTCVDKHRKPRLPTSSHQMYLLWLIVCKKNLKKNPKDKLHELRKVELYFTL